MFSASSKILIGGHHGERTPSIAGHCRRFCLNNFLELKFWLVTSWLVLVGGLSQLFWQSALYGLDNPNRKVGPAGVGGERQIAKKNEIFYTIFFNNDLVPPQPLKRIEITDVLDPNLDWTTFQFRDQDLGGLNIQMNVNTDFDPSIGVACWLFLAVDPDEFQPNDGGSVSFSILPRAEVKDNTSISNQATIILGDQSLTTNSWGNILSSKLAGTAFQRGDPTADGKEDISDAIFILRYRFLGEVAPTCLDSADADDSGEVDITDAIIILQHLFIGGVPPLPPFPDCGLDPTDDQDPSCDSYPPCS